MRLGVRGKLFLVSCALVVGVVLVAGLVAEREIRGFLVARIETELLNDARAAQTIVERSGRGTIDDRVDELGAALGVRLTVVRDDGVVLGDSGLAPGELAAVENHAARPEVQAARSVGRGTAVRFSTTMRTDMMYVAVPFAGDGTAGVVRAATPLHDVDEALARMRALLVAAGLVGAVLAIFMSALASELSSRAVRDLVARTRRRAVGAAVGAAAGDGDEIHALAGTFAQLSRELDGVVAASTEERDRMHAVLEGMQEAVVAIDDQARIVLVNRAAHGLLAIDGDPRGRPLVDVVRAPALLDAVGRAAAGQPARAELTIGKASMAAHATPTALRGVVLVLEDVTDVVRLERVRKDFVANVSHELRTPVSVISANAELLLEGGLDEARARAFLEAIARHAERLSRLVADLLDLSRLESGTSALEARRLAVAEVCERAAESVRARAAAKHQRLDVDVDPAVAASADAKALDQVLVNLLDNAVKYTQEGGRIAVQAAERDGAIEIAVKDDGPGIAPEHRGRLFERFYRVDAGRSREMGGTGLGLAIVKHLVEAMHGTVTVDAVAPHGSRFVVRLPRG